MKAREKNIWPRKMKPKNTQINLGLNGTGNNSGRFTFDGEFESIITQAYTQITDGVGQIQPLF